LAQLGPGAVVFHRRPRDGAAPAARSRRDAGSCPRDPDAGLRPARPLVRRDIRHRDPMAPAARLAALSSASHCTMKSRSGHLSGAQAEQVQQDRVKSQNTRNALGRFGFLESKPKRSHVRLAVMLAGLLRGKTTVPWLIS